MEHAGTEQLSDDFAEALIIPKEGERVMPFKNECLNLFKFTFGSHVPAAG